MNDKEIMLTVDAVNIVISSAFALARMAGKTDEEINAMWQESRKAYESRPSTNLNKVSE